MKKDTIQCVCIPFWLNIVFGFNVFFMSNINSDELGNSFMHESLFLSVFNTFRQPTTHYKNSALFSVIFRRAQKTDKSDP